LMIINRSAEFHKNLHCEASSTQSRVQLFFVMAGWIRECLHVCTS
jgi:hypothetical protein